MDTTTSTTHTPGDTGSALTGFIAARPPRPVDSRLRHYVQVAAVVLVVACCYLVLRPFLPALLFAAVVCSATWPVYEWLRERLGGRPALAALGMTVLLIVLVIGPTVLLAVSLADNVTELAEQARVLLHGGPIAAPEWVSRIPVVGDLLAENWKRIANGRDSMLSLAKGLLAPARDFLIGTGKAVGEGLLQVTVAGFIGFFFYRDGEALVQALRTALDKIAGGTGEALIETMAGTVKGVVVGIFGTAFAQALVALAGFLIAGVPAPFFLAAATFFLSVLPIGPPLLWGGATLWLLYGGQVGWALFMALYGFLCISTIDNVVKPYLISRSSNLPLLLTVLGVLGGVIAFGFIGLFIGPPLLAIGLAVVKLWLAHRAGEPLVPGVHGVTEAASTAAPSAEPAQR